MEQAQVLGVTLTVAGGRLQYSPKSRTPFDFVQVLQEHKEELLRHLTALAEKDSPHRTQNPHNPQNSKAYVGPADFGAFEVEDLLAWASRLAEHELALPHPVTYIEAPLRSITTERVSRQASIYLKTVLRARHQQQTGGWHPYTVEWWQEREEEALGALAALRQAVHDLEASETTP